MLCRTSEFLCNSGFWCLYCNYQGIPSPIHKGKVGGVAQKYSLQSGIDNNIGTGKQTNSKEEHGVAYSNDNKITYHIKSTQLYNCNRGERRQLKPEVSNCLKRWNAAGSRKLGCQATMQTKLIQLSSGQTVLEIWIRSLKAHSATHDLKSIFDQLSYEPLPEIEEKVYSLVQGAWLHDSDGSHSCCLRLGKEGAHSQASTRTSDNRSVKWI